MKMTTVRKLNGIIILWLYFFTILGSSESARLNFEIYYDSNSQNEFAVKEKIYDIYKELVAGLDQEDRVSWVLRHQKMFQLESDWEISSDQNTLIIVIGDGKGTFLSGEFEWDLCHNEVKPKSWILEVLGY